MYIRDAQFRSPVLSDEIFGRAFRIVLGEHKGVLSHEALKKAIDEADKNKSDDKNLCAVAPDSRFVANGDAVLEAVFAGLQERLVHPIELGEELRLDGEP